MLEGRLLRSGRTSRPLGMSWGGQDRGVHMRDVELFQMALGLASPWYVERTEFDADAKRLDWNSHGFVDGRSPALHPTRAENPAGDESHEA